MGIRENRWAFQVKGAEATNPGVGELGTPGQTKGPSCLGDERPETQGTMFCLCARHQDTVSLK